MRWLLCPALAGALLGCASQTQPTYPVGATLTSPLAFGSKRIPLPDGDWYVASAKVSLNNLSHPIQQLFLLNRRANAETVGVEVLTNVVPTTPTGGWMQLSACSRKDMLFARPPATYGVHEQDCWFVNHLVPGRTDGTSTLRREALDAAQAEGRPLPNVLIYAGFRVADSSDVVTARYFFDPAAAGIASVQLASWQANEWHVDRVARSPERRAYVDKVIAWGRKWFPKMQDGFRGRDVP